MWEKLKIIHGLPKVGDKVIYIEPAISWFTNIEKDCSLLEVGKEYTVRKTELGSSASFIWLEEFPEQKSNGEPFFSTASFSWELPELDLNELIGIDPRILLRLTTTYGINVQIDGKTFGFISGAKTLVVEYKDDLTIKVYWKEDV